MKKFNGLTLGLDFFSGVLAGAFIGYSLDYFFQTKPFLTCLFLVFGFAAGVNNVLKLVKKSKKDEN